MEHTDTGVEKPEAWRNTGQQHGALKIGPFNILGDFPFLYFILKYLVSLSGASLVQIQTPCLWP